MVFLLRKNAFLTLVSYESKMQVTFCDDRMIFQIQTRPYALRDSNISSLHCGDGAVSHLVSRIVYLRD